jgi:hypothetical protein
MMGRVEWRFDQAQVGLRGGRSLAGIRIRPHASSSAQYARRRGLSHVGMEFRDIRAKPPRLDPQGPERGGLCVVLVGEGAAQERSVVRFVEDARAAVWGQARGVPRASHPEPATLTYL